MPVLAVHTSGSFDHVCEAAGRTCGHIRRGLRLAPRHPHGGVGLCTPACFVQDAHAGGGVARLHPEHGDLIVTEAALVTRPCPLCGTVEALFRCHLPHDAGEEPQPGSLVGTIFPDVGPRGSIVAEHSVGAHGDPFRRQQCALIRQMQRHPDLAAHAPLHEAVLIGQALMSAGHAIRVAMENS